MWLLCFGCSAAQDLMRATTYSFDEEAPPDDPNQPKFIYSRSISAAVYLSHVRLFELLASTSL
jgi:hypothetical protein